MYSPYPADVGVDAKRIVPVTTAKSVNRVAPCSLKLWIPRERHVQLPMPRLHGKGISIRRRIKNPRRRGITGSYNNSELFAVLTGEFYSFIEETPIAVAFCLFQSSPCLAQKHHWKMRVRPTRFVFKIVVWIAHMKSGDHIHATNSKTLRRSRARCRCECGHRCRSWSCRRAAVQQHDNGKQ